MPTYQYRCQEHNHEFEAVQKFSDDALTACQVCGGPVKKVFSGVGISFKGDGFYKNDHGAGAKSRSSTDTASTDGSSSSSGSDGASASPEKKKEKAEKTEKKETSTVKAASAASTSAD